MLPLGIALLLNKAFPGRTMFRAIFFAPYVLGVAVIGVLFRYLLDPNIGVVNNYLHDVGIDRNIPWITQLPWAWISLVAMTVWWTLGFNAIIYLAGLQDISPELYDAADIDGASRWQKFRNVTMPGLRPVMLFVLTVTILASANMFGQSYLVTNGAPNNETRTAIFYISQVGLRQYRQGAAAAMSYILAIILILISLVNFRLFRDRDANDRATAETSIDDHRHRSSEGDRAAAARPSASQAAGGGTAAPRAVLGADPRLDADLRPAARLDVVHVVQDA